MKPVGAAGRKRRERLIRALVVLNERRHVELSGKRSELARVASEQLALQTIESGTDSLSVFFPKLMTNRMGRLQAESVSLSQAIEQLQHQIAVEDKRIERLTESTQTMTLDPTAADIEDRLAFVSTIADPT